ncbi:MAG TPA: transporter substrate-binding domain-containing protein [Beijerinckiaceae bacterium]|jgi:polar amino acid transport system substrate-binding protein
MNRGGLHAGLLGLALGLLAAAFATPTLAQGVAIPNFWDPRARQERPDLSGLRTVRFLTDDDFPPLHFVGPDGAPTGFSVELARAACERLAITCTIQVRRFDTLADALSEARGDVIAAAMPITPELRRRFSATLPYFRFPARFAVRADKGQPEPAPRALEGRSVAVVQGTAHEAYVKAFFSRATVRGFDSLVAAEAALRRGEADYVFGDGLGLSLWIGGTDAAGCCGFIGGPYLESRFFGEGIGFVVRKDDELLRRALDHALQRLWDEGKYAELYLRFFPVSPF